MKTRLLYTFVALTGAASMAHAQNPLTTARDAARKASGQNSPASNDQGRAAAQKALEQYYGNTGKLRITGERDVNGVRVYDAEISGTGGTAMASATANGDLIETGTPSSSANLPEPVRQISQGLFQTAASDVDWVETHYYYAHVNAGGQPFMIMMDATGKILSIKSSAQLKEDAPTNSKEATGAERDQVTKLTQQHFAGAKVGDIRANPHSPGFYQAFFTVADGPGYIILNPKTNEVGMFHLPSKRNTLPQPVQQALNTILKGDKVGAVGHGADRLYRITQTAGGTPITLLVHSDGDIERLEEGNQRAITASQRTGGKK